MLYTFAHANAVISCANLRPQFFRNADTSRSGAIQSQLVSHKKGLYCPQSVDRFYEQNGYNLVLIAPDTVKTHASEVMLMLDCVLQFGLNYADYHPPVKTSIVFMRLNLYFSQFKCSTSPPGKE
jgi:hypothetical protein